MRCRGWYLLGVAASLALGCAGSTPSPPLPMSEATSEPMPPPVETPGLGACWAGHYEGSGKVFRQADGAWLSQVPIRLVIQPLLSQRLGIAGAAGADSFFFVATPTDSLRLEGEAQQAAARYSYSLARTGGSVAGSVAASAQSDQVGPYLPGDEWVFEVHRSAGP